jgi:hypothetical protein
MATYLYSVDATHGTTDNAALYYTVDATIFISFRSAINSSIYAT